MPMTQNLFSNGNCLDPRIYSTLKTWNPLTFVKKKPLHIKPQVRLREWENCIACYLYTNFEEWIKRGPLFCLPLVHETTLVEKHKVIWATFPSVTISTENCSVVFGTFATTISTTTTSARSTYQIRILLHGIQLWLYRYTIVWKMLEPDGWNLGTLAMDGITYLHVLCGAC
jgi:hypothetical protein